MRSQRATGRGAEPFVLHHLATFPCGCVAADFRARSLDVDLWSLEAKGPHCVFDGHRVGQVLGIAECADLDELGPAA